jgi:DNA-binding LacI/PurR family transcriptional regulator
LLKLSPRPTAVFVASDVVALGAMQAIENTGARIPEDIAVVGFDDIPLAEYYNPPLTTLRLPAYKLGWAVGERLVHFIQGTDTTTGGVFLESELIVRKSSMKRIESL